MSLIRINRHPSKKDLRVFAILWIIFLSGFGYLAYHESQTALAVVLVILAALIGITGLILPRATRWVYLGMAYAVFPIGFVVSHFLLAMVFYAVLTPIGLLMRILGRDPLHRRFERDRDSYWEVRPGQRPPASYFKQY